MDTIRTPLPDLVLSCIGEQLDCSATLKILAGLSHHFRCIFAPIWLSRISLTTRIAYRCQDGSLREPSYLWCTKDLRVEGTGDTEEDPLRNSSLLMSILSQVPNLEIFRWKSRIWTRDQTKFSHTIPHFHLYLPLDVLTSLQHNCPKLRHLSLQLEVTEELTASRWAWYERNLEDYLEVLHYQAPCPVFDISGFRNLRTLEVLHINGNLRRQARNLAVALARSPKISSLAISLQAAAAVFNADYAGTDDPEREHNKFCWRLCDIFSNELNQPPLLLEHLHVGKWLEMTSVDLKRLTQAALLEQVYISAGFYIDDDFGGYTGEKQPDYMVYSYLACPSLWEISTKQESIDDLPGDFDTLLDSWPKLEVDGQKVSPWEKVENIANLVYRCKGAVPKNIKKWYYL